MAHTLVGSITLVGMLALGSAVSVAQATVAGNWSLDVDSPQGLMKVALVLAVEGEGVRGTISSDMGESKFTGTVKDGAVTFNFDMSGPQGPMSVTTRAAVTGDDIKGEMDYGMGVAPFTGKRTRQ